MNIEIRYGQRPNHYLLRSCQKNNVKGVEVTYYTTENMWGIIIGFLPTMKEAKLFILDHMKKTNKED